MRLWRLMSTLLLLAVGGMSASQADEFAIQSFDGMGGHIAFTGVEGATNYQVQAAATPTGTWNTVCGPIAPTGANTITTTVSRAGAVGFYRVMAFTHIPTAPQPQLYLVVDLSGGPSASSYPISYLTNAPAGGWTDEYKSAKLVMRKISAGTFTMGSPPGELESWEDRDETQRAVTLTNDFYIGVFEVTQRQWELVMDSRPSWFNNNSHYATRPVECVTYYEIRENPANVDDPAVTWPLNKAVNVNSFIGRLRIKTGLSTFDLPTESQWEYACRAGTPTALNSNKNLTDTEACPNMSEVGRYWYNGGYERKLGCAPSAGTATVGSYLPNAWGLYDMHGNVWEWCLDYYVKHLLEGDDPDGPLLGSHRVKRGGSWALNAQYCRSALRSYNQPNDMGSDYGFRVARTLP